MIVLTAWVTAETSPRRLRAQTTMTLAWIAQWLRMGSWTYTANPIYEITAQRKRINNEDLLIILPLLAGEGCLLLSLSLGAITCAIIGLVGAKRHPGNWKVAGPAIVLTLLAVAGSLVPIIILSLAHDTAPGG